MRILVPLAAFVILAGCATTPVKEIETQIVRVPVAVPCIPEGFEPTEVVPLRDRIPREEWDAMSTDQRAAALSGNGVKRVIYQTETEIVLVACGDVGEVDLSTIDLDNQ